VAFVHPVGIGIIILVFSSRCIRVCDVGGRGSGAGRGGGGGGSIRESGGKLGEMAAAKEDEYFYKKVRPATVMQVQWYTCALNHQSMEKYLQFHISI
jgi:Mitochondrial ATPase inhibitor, IATP.